MLILKRKRGESVVIGDVIEITILGSGTAACTLGISAPRGIKILRKEIKACSPGIATKSKARPA